MPEHEYISLVIFAGFFLFTTSIIHNTTKKGALLPYTSALLLVGLICQLIVHQLGYETNLSLSPNVIYYVLLPLLLFDSAMTLNLRQLKLQFKTIAFLATFGLLTSMTIIGIGLSWLLNIPIVVGLLFGTIISATDPMAVFTLFKSLGVPKRLGLLAEGESLLNDTSAIVSFRVILALALATTTVELNTIFLSISDLIVVLAGSALLGSILGFGLAWVTTRLKNDPLIETTLTAGLAVSLFVVVEYLFHFSGVISTVAAGFVFGHLGKTKFSPRVIQLMEEFWKYISFVAISLVFFFSTFNLDILIFNQNLVGSMVVIGLMLVGRSVSVYLSFLVSNHTRMFSNEPKVPLKWQHIINWGGLRGVISLILVYTLPDSFAYKQDFLSFTLSAFLFTLLVNAASLRTLLKTLGIHVAKADEALIWDEEQLIKLGAAKKAVNHLSPSIFEPKLIRQAVREITKQEAGYKKDLLEKSGYTKLLRSLELQALRLKGNTYRRLLQEGSINQSVYFDLETALDLQMDALEYPEFQQVRILTYPRFTDNWKTFKYQFKRFSAFVRNHRVLSGLLGLRPQDLIVHQMNVLKAQILSSQDVIEHMRLLKRPLADAAKALTAVRAIITDQEKISQNSQKQLDSLEDRYPMIAQNYQNKIIYGLIKTHTRSDVFEN